MKSQLITLGMTNILFLPILKLQTKLEPTFDSAFFKNGYVVPVNTTVNKTTDALSGSNVNGVLSKSGKLITVDQGLDSDKLDQTLNLQDINPPLYENSYNIYIDSRFGYISADNTNTLQPLSIDDDGIAVYKFTQQSTGTNTSYVNPIVYNSSDGNNQIILGTQGSRLKFGITPNANLYTNTYFDRYGDSDVVLNSQQTGKQFMTLRSTVRVVGVTTGYTLEIPILYAKVQVP